MPHDEGEEGSASSDVQEFHPYDPHRAAKDIEVGDFYFKKKNYGAALERYREALFYKPNDALANFRMAEAFDKLAQLDDAAEHYQEYLRDHAQRPAIRRGEEGARENESPAPSEKIKPSNKTSFHENIRPRCHPERSCSFRSRKEYKSKDP